MRDWVRFSFMKRFILGAIGQWIVFFSNICLHFVIYWHMFHIYGAVEY